MFLKHNGYFYDSQHNRLQGFTMPDKLLADPCTLTDIKAPVEELEPRATSNAYINLNLNAKDKIPSGPFDDKNPNTYNYTTQVSIFDDIGATHDVIAYYVMNILNDWSVYLKIDGLYVIKGNLLFDGNGERSVSSGFDEIIFTPAGRQHTQTIKIDYAKTTQLPEVTAIRSISADGYVRADFVEEKVDANGYISARYSNAQVITFSKIAVYSKS
jgi:flagellar hook protein FlgE